MYFSNNIIFLSYLTEEKIVELFKNITFKVFVKNDKNGVFWD